MASEAREWANEQMRIGFLRQKLTDRFVENHLSVGDWADRELLSVLAYECIAYESHDNDTALMDDIYIDIEQILREGVVRHMEVAPGLCTERLPLRKIVSIPDEDELVQDVSDEQAAREKRYRSWARLMS